MKSVVGLAILALLVVVHAEEKAKVWSWGKDVDTVDPQEPTAEEYIVADESAYVQQYENVNATGVEDVIDNILVSNRQGRNIEGFDEVYRDPNVKKALESGDDTEARNIIKDRLCDLGLMQCEGKSYPNRPSVTPEELIYAQPVDIQPIGRPIPSIPVRGPPRAYGPPKPSFNGPPPYSGSYRPGPPGLGSFASSNSFSGAYQSGSSFHSKPLGPIYDSKPPGPIYKPPGPIYNSKPPGPLYSGSVVDVEPYEFDHPIKPSFVKENKQYVASASSLTGEVVQQHVHHHYHHGDDKSKPTVIVNTPLGSESHSHLHTSGSSSFQSGGFSPVNSGLGSPGGLYSNIKPVYEGSSPGYASGVYKESQNQAGVYNLNYAAGQSYNPSNSFGSTVGSFGNTNQFYKKELNTAPANNNLLGSGYYNQYSNQFGYKGQESSRTENFDCVCVPYDQCPSQDIIGRKDDLFLPIDPRNLKKDIDALPEEEKVVITHGNGTMTVVRVAKMVQSDNATEAVGDGAEKKVAKRETNDKASDSANKANIAPRQSGSDDDESRGLFGKKIQPTFGVSFGLNNGHGGYGGYPINPYGPTPFINPYGSSIGGGGVNLGLVNVDPLVSVQVTKNDYGEKVIKPLVNLHVTPNANLVHKIGSIFEHKKQLLFKKPFFGGYGGFGGGFGGGYGGGYPPHSVHSHYHYGPYKPHGPPHHHGPHYPPPHFERPYPPPHYHGHGPPLHGVFRDDDDFHGDFSGPGPYINDADEINTFGNADGGFHFGRSVGDQNNQGGVAQDYAQNNYAQNYNGYNQVQNNPGPPPNDGRRSVKFPTSRRRRETSEEKIDQSPIKDENIARNKAEKRQAYFGQPQQQQCGPRHVCCKRPYRPQIPVANRGQCGARHSQGINGRIKTPAYVDGDSEFGEYPWQAAILKKDPKESVYVCGGTLIDHLHIITAAHCVKTYTGFDLRVRLGEWDVNHDVEFYPYIERDVVSVHVHPQYYAGTLDNDIAILKLDRPVDWTKYPHISPACLPDKFTDFTGARCWTTGWGKDAFGDFGKYQNILKEVDVPVIGHHQCEAQLRQTRLGYQYQLNPGFICAGGEEGKDACKGDGGGPMVCERGGTWQLVGVVSWGIGCGQVNVPGVYVKVSHYLDWISQVAGRF